MGFFLYIKTNTSVFKIFECSIPFPKLHYLVSILLQMSASNSVTMNLKALTNIPSDTDRKTQVKKTTKQFCCFFNQQTKLFERNEPLFTFNKLQQFITKTKTKRNNWQPVPTSKKQEHRLPKNRNIEHKNQQIQHSTRNHCQEALQWMTIQKKNFITETPNNWFLHINNSIHTSHGL